MKKTLLFLLFACFILANGYSQTIKSPSEFLGYPLGSQFTYHYKIADYFKYIASVSKHVKLQQYGSTNEGRPLMAAFIASDENIDRLEEIRLNNQRITGIESGTASLNTPVIVWLSYNVHGNEPSSSEAAMQTLYDMVNPANARTQAWLKNTVVVIDPCLNPDGRDRYVNFYNQVRDLVPDANPSSREHMEPWPGGRVNHYYFDLNRDWAWQTQKETQARVGLFNHWLPQVHVDFHEQGYNEPYYFAPAAEPFHADITKFQRDFQTVIGKNNAKYFDQNGWMYFTKERFDLLYPSYGDTYPIYNGSIGMTYEQGGIRAGLAVVTADGDTLTLKDRIAHHHSNSLSTIETASANSAKLLTEFKQYYDHNRSNPPGEYKAYVVKNDNPDNIARLAQMLKRNGIQFGFGAGKSAVGFNYFDGKTENFNIAANDMVINAHQPKAVLLNVLFEPKTFVADSNTYDITAWGLPFAYGLKTYGLKEGINATAAEMPVKERHTEQAINNAYAYVSTWKSMEDVSFLAALLKQNIKVRYAELPFEAGGKRYETGSLVITRAGNKRPDFDEVVKQTALKCNRELSVLTSGFVDKGADLGSSAVHYIGKPRVMLVTGEGTSSAGVGEVWQLFEQQIGYPVTLARMQDLNRLRLGDFDVIILPDGGYTDLPADKIQSWVNDGGKLIALENAVSHLVEKKGFAIKLKDDKKADKADKKAAPFASARTFEDRERDAIKNSIPGAIFKVDMDNTHPLAFGLPKYYYTLKLTDQVYEPLTDNNWNVGTIKKGAYVSGFVGQKVKEKLTEGLLFGVQNAGRGTIVYLADDPLFRSFWENGKLLFSNAVFMVGQ
jgi:hypothetical protein